MIDFTAMSLKQIKEKLEEYGPYVPEELLEALRKDGRAGAKKLAAAIERQNQEKDNVLQHFRELGDFDRKYGCRVVGIDEAGRGPLAGPVVAAAVELDPDHIDWAVGIDDSKKLTREKRREICATIKAKALFCGIGVVEASVIDQMNILNATHLAMAKAIKDAKEGFLCLVDGLPVPRLGRKQEAIVKGDAKSLSIAAASIVAKETRDSLMDHWDAVYPEYGFAKHKGYGTKEHYIALERYGPCPIHRKSFLTGFELRQGVLF